MNILGIIPARYASTRFPGKPLAMIGDKPMIQWVWEGVSRIEELSHVVVATDDERIYRCVKAFGGNVMMTGTHHRSGTDRCGEVLQRMGSDANQYDVVINIQGDEPRVAASQIATLAHCFDNPDIQHVRELLGEAMKTLQDKDAFGRDIVDSKRGITVSLEEMDDSAVTLAVKQQVLVAERVGYIDRAKELIYNTLNENGISIPFPQCDVHLVKEE